jgi:hypothetical protein
MEKTWIRDKHSGSATLITLIKGTWIWTLGTRKEALLLYLEKSGQKRMRIGRTGNFEDQKKKDKRANKGKNIWNNLLSEFSFNCNLFNFWS